MTQLLFDTNVVIDILRGRKAIVERLRTLEGSLNLFLSVIVIGELRFGAERSAKPNEERQRVAEFAVRCQIIPCTIETTRLYAITKHQMVLKGRPLPENDLWIAATALQHRLILATRDAHFDDIDGLAIERW